MDINAIKSKLATLQSTTSTKDNFWKPAPGKTQIRIVPYKYNKENPFVELFFHYGFFSLGRFCMHRKKLKKTVSSEKARHLW